MIRAIRRHLAWKIFLTYLLIVLVGAAVLASTAELATPAAFDRHMAAMQAMMGPAISQQMGTSLFGNFQAAFNEALMLAVGAAVAVAALASVLVARQVVLPIQEMMSASQRIAKGRYDERVNVAIPASQDDVDELGQLALSFNQMAAELERTEDRRIELIGDIAHELRTPLTTIKGSMEGLIDGVLPADPGTYHRVAQEAERLQRLVEDLQELSRVESGASPLHLGPVDATAAVVSVADRLRFQFEDKGVTLRDAELPELPAVLADDDRLRQVLTNLLGNALQYTPGDGSVWVEGRSVGDRVELTVHDTGIGIAPDQLPHVFDRFYRVDKSRSRAGGGSGIGLTIAKELIEAMGGRLWARSPGPGQGSTFGFELPVA